MPQTAIGGRGETPTISAYHRQSVDSSQQLLLSLNAAGLPLPLIHPLSQRCEGLQGSLQVGVVRVTGGCVLEEVLNEEDISRDALDWLDEKVVETKLPFTVPRKLLGGKKKRD